MAKQNTKKNRQDIAVRSNEQLYGDYQVRVVFPGEEGNTETKVCSLREAKHLAKDMELDIFEINAKAVPPVLKIGDLSKYLYELKKHRKQQTTLDIKEINLSVNIASHDLEIKSKKAREFIEKGHKVKVTLMMKRRETQRREESKKCIMEFILLLSNVAVPESMPRDEGNKCIVILKKKK